MRCAFVLLLAAVVLPGVALAGDADGLVSRAEEAFRAAVAATDSTARREAFAAAAARYEEALLARPANGALEYDCANAHLLAGHVGRAILRYRRAERLLPGDERVATNLAVARARRRDRIEASASQSVLETVAFWHRGLPLPTKVPLAAALPMEIERVLSFWLGAPPRNPAELEAKKLFWFTGGKAIDHEIRARFGDLVEQARAGALSDWTQTPRGTLALLILLDQFSRNVFRGTKDAFSHDPVCLELARSGFDTGFFDELDPIERMFVALPFRHAEDVDAQKRAVSLAVQDALRTNALLRDYHIYSVDWARKHLDVIVRFGRFPHRNAALGRVSTPEEIDYLAYLALAEQWL